MDSTLSLASSEPGGLILCTPEDSRHFGERVASHLDIMPTPMEERDFEDGEHKARPSGRGAELRLSACTLFQQG